MNTARIWQWPGEKYWAALLIDSRSVFLFYIVCQSKELEHGNTQMHNFCEFCASHRMCFWDWVKLNPQCFLSGNGTISFFSLFYSLTKDGRLLAHIQHNEEQMINIIIAFSLCLSFLCHIEHLKTLQFGGCKIFLIIFCIYLIILSILIN